MHRELRRLGRVTVVAPDAERSAIGHAITTLTPLRVKEYRQGRTLTGHACNGTPADCVKLAVSTICKEDPPDLVVSGINLGANTATNVLYSGTVSAATEARILGVPSMAISLATLRDPDWAYAASLGRRIAAEVLERGLPPRVLLNVNVPNLPRARIQGIRVCRQGEAIYVEEFSERQDPRRQPYYWLAATHITKDEDPQTDSWAVEHGYVAITPISLDLTAHHVLGELEAWNWRR
jgi:5'-nucleotidase